MMALLTRDGGLIYQIMYGKESDMSVNTRNLVKSIYIGHTIISAIEVKEEGRIINIVRLEDTTSMIIVRIEDGEMEEMKHYQKSK